ncbi:MULTISPECIES: Y-family DNA polymerase [Thiorhodovibrio]|uniref:Y-family DNA polymerase n=1 Tax=Thiorhodovibrio TaxID=61593 RepID=UPI0019121B8D|nr:MULTISPECIES: DNA polymerase Y family protein [Thiorhodovibrio]MBK5969905.1 hypothetical protein [Thiorhodovibrio winogradskyi]WPL12050.1 Nucleotidyltransferase/DNA polymerase involved in DNA repair [Thiorhodovibrio litoralis]
MRDSCWLALWFPELPLEVYQRAWGEERPLAIVEGGHVIACNAAARSAGVRVGGARLAALALCAELATRVRRPGVEQAALEWLAAWALRFSDQVSLEPPQGLVIEAGRSLQLFGGAEAFYQAVVKAGAALGYRLQLCMAPTPAGALLLAAWGCEEIIGDTAELRQRLAPLPPSVAGLSARALADCQRMGVRCIGDLLALPRSGLTERFGVTFVDALARLLGDKPDPRRPFEPPDHYHGELELPAEVQEAEALMVACRQLLAELCGLLQARRALVPALYWTWCHADGERTVLRLGSAKPEADMKHWLLLLRERLAGSPAPAPVREIVLDTDRFCSQSRTTGDLFSRQSPLLGAGLEADLQPGSSDGADLLDRLRARLGDDAVKTLVQVDDHRPERAWRWVDAQQPPDSRTARVPWPSQRKPSSESLLFADSASAERPLWLLQTPLRLRLRDGCLWLADPAASATLPALVRAQPLRFCGGRERIETGWWDRHPVARDYFRVQAASGERFWAYRSLSGDCTRGGCESGSADENRPGAPDLCWYLHGAFGF